MALDGIVIANMVKELNESILGGKINKIAQPENDELLITIKNNKTQYRLLISAGASLPLIYFTQKNKPGPLTAPNFCMLLRKYIGSGKFTKIWQPGLERIIHFEIEHLNEMGDLCRKDLIVEIMGKHSNIIFCDDKGMIIDSIKHVSAQMSSIREVLPGRNYFIPATSEKYDPLIISERDFKASVCTRPMPLAKALYMTLTGISPLIAEEICHRSSLESSQSANSLSESEQTHLYHIFSMLMDNVRTGHFSPLIIYNGKEPVEFSSVPLTQYQDFTSLEYTAVSDVLETYYAAKNAITRIRQRSADIRRIVQTALERDYKKYDLQLRQLKDTEKREKYKVYGELINAYGYGLEPGTKKLDALNYYTNEMISIPLDPTMTPQENARKNFDRYNKLKRTCEALQKLTVETKEAIEHLESIRTALDIALSEEDLVQIKEELTQYGYIRRKHAGKKVKITSRPLHFLSGDGYHIYVGKNNFQNEELTFKFASGNDWWFHAKGAPGSHVIVKNPDGGEMPDRTYEEAARLAAHYSANSEAEKTEIDYVQKKHVKKVNGKLPGFVIYHTNYSMLIDSDISEIEQII
ncbi:MAG: fibronectin/fibrinogen-binding protein [Lachnospiraceae bacterium]|jgi:predicted ribosome quality control (RQC) complex YloA/Tae2 family protein|uniref:Rqc2 family fibronectin-binding protein n=1 Tax=Hominisplanchenecus murintestinalis TaxID=2941517 RepID=UPI000EA105D7|nr:NFACT RNA binding domain-containing protein [Hominisplanchenecus murintestinalis]MCI9516306.1 fibronectin/fibrinogen-binding protein [Lachnospiraceae bacterium]RKJ95735.1 fibronectin/fibrinogen-binding protein [Anaerotruncus sp. 1XD22-93]MCI9660749.1 fibronectin/fibrinogen-binding protein [Lachnospiraceae bacterium]NBH97751.1 fibronectin/fibrinogen-binding protein [Lachnospiraceae bacterium]NBI74807.1 fibronectin/fibrinogen-binding protein [Lachnospiraceae bacterium]